MDYTPDPDLVRALTAKVADEAIEELRDIIPMDISEVGEAELEYLAPELRDATVQAVRTAIRDLQITYTLDAEPAQPPVSLRPLDWQEC